MRKITILLGAVLCCSVLLTGCGNKYNYDTTNISQEDTSHSNNKLKDKDLNNHFLNENNEKQKFEDAYLTNYMMIAYLIKQYDSVLYDGIPEEGPDTPMEVITGFEINDIDNDGKKELLVESIPTDISLSHLPILITFDAAENPHYNVWHDLSAAGSSEYLIVENDNCTYLHKDYTTKNLHNELLVWGDKGWETYSLLEKEGDEVIKSEWNGQKVEEAYWSQKLTSINVRGLTNTLNEQLFIETDCPTSDTASAIYNYFSKYVKSFILDAESEERYYIILDDYFHSMWKTMDDSEYVFGNEMFANWEYDCLNKDLIIVVEENKNGSKISAVELPKQTNISNVRFENGIVIEEENGIFKYQINSNYEVELVKKIYVSNVEEKLISSKWYSVQSEENGTIFEYTFGDNCVMKATEYTKQGEELEGISCNYTYNESEDCLILDYGQYQMKYLYDDSNGGFIITADTMDDGFDYSDTYDVYGYYYIGERCMLPYNKIPEFSELYRDCDCFMKKYDSTSLEYKQ